MRRSDIVGVRPPEQRRVPPRPGLLWSVFLLLVLLWGSVFLAAKKALVVFSPEELACIRYMATGVVLAPWALRSVRTVRRETLGPLLICGFVGSVGPVLLVNFAQLSVSSATAGMFSALTPIVAALVGWLFFSNRISSREAAALVIGFSGALLLMLSRQQGGDTLALSPPSLLLLLACVCWSVSAQVTRRYLYRENTLAMTGWAFLFILPVAWGGLLAYGTLPRMLAADATPVAFALLCMLISTAAVIGYNWLIVNGGPLFALSTTYLVPVVAIAWGLLDGETVQPLQFLGLALALLGLWLMQRR